MELAIEDVGSELLTNVVASECQRECYEACVYEACLSAFVGDICNEVLQYEVHQAGYNVFQQERMKKISELQALAKEQNRRTLNRYWKM